MKRIADLLFMSAGGYAGWFVGALVGIFTAFILSMVGVGVGLYASRRLAARYLP